MSRKYSPEEKVRLLAEFEKLRSGGMKVNEVAQTLNVPRNTLYTWKNRARLKNGSLEKYEKSQPQLISIPVAERAMPPQKKTDLSIVIMKGDPDVVDRIANNLSKILSEL